MTRLSGTPSGCDLFFWGWGRGSVRALRVRTRGALLPCGRRRRAGGGGRAALPRAGGGGVAFESPVGVDCSSRAPLHLAGGAARRLRPAGPPLPRNPPEGTAPCPQHRTPRGSRWPVERRAVSLAPPPRDRRTPSLLSVPSTSASSGRSAGPEPGLSDRQTPSSCHARMQRRPLSLPPCGSTSRKFPEREFEARRASVRACRRIWAWPTCRRVRASFARQPVGRKTRFSSSFRARVTRGRPQSLPGAPRTAKPQVEVS
ncbi:hypothetical protein ANANG_G00284480 [Anguilla anguilla]|uniref:Uncharacterized protein n=1 Tax=Anguilla anguilla TaxID=7936 RepID=A0A9D3LNT5_ANGAN|nr:hypothetical protein ANANG_G00284480 [Anguilla anguilla]